MNHLSTNGADDILIVDDTPANLRLLSQMLGERGHRVRAVTSGVRALASARAAVPDLVLLDIKMPEMNGYDVCAGLKADARTSDIPVIFISALDELEDKVRAFQVGGVDYVTKPFQVEEVLARVEAHLSLRRLQRQLQDVNQRMAQELALAGDVQASFLPAELPRLPGWQLAATLRPARTTSGDFYDIITLPDGRLGFVVADVVDKGVEAALFMALAWTLIRVYVHEYPTEPERVFGLVNQRILADTHSGQFLTAFLGVLDPVTGTLIYCNAGHNPPRLFRSAGQPAEPLDRTGMLLGVLEGTTWRRAGVQLSPGDALVLHTDGVTDAEDANGTFFGEDRFLESIHAQLGRPPELMLDGLLGSIGSFVGGAEQSDDIALMILARDAT